MSSNTQSSPGNFSYPPPKSNLQFNYIDSLITSWLIFDSDPTECNVSLWYWPNTDPWRNGYSRTATANSTGLMSLNVGGSYYLGQLNFNYFATDGKRQQIDSPIFTVDFSPQSSAVTWSQGTLPLPTSSASVSSQTSLQPPSQTSTLATPATSNTLRPAATTSKQSSSVSLAAATHSPLSVNKSSSTSGSGLGPGAIAGIVIGIVICAGLFAFLMFFCWSRRRNRVPAEDKASSSAHSQLPVPRELRAEVEGSLSRPKEVSGPKELFGGGELPELAASGR